jgi:ATP-dependent Zn protease
MAVAQRMKRPVPSQAFIAGIVISLLVGVVALVNAWNNSASPSTVPYSQFLSDIEAGQVTRVVQVGTTLDVSGSQGTYRVTLPNVLTDVYADVEEAATGSGATVPLFEAQPEPDSSWIEFLLTGLLPFALILVVFGLVLLLVGRPARRELGRTLTDRLRELEDAHQAGLISDEERARRRSRILDET